MPNNNNYDRFIILSIFLTPKFLLFWWIFLKKEKILFDFGNIEKTKIESVSTELFIGKLNWGIIIFFNKNKRTEADSVMENPVNWLLRQKNKLLEVKIPQISDIVSDCESPTKSDRSSPNKKSKCQDALEIICGHLCFDLIIILLFL